MDKNKITKTEFAKRCGIRANHVATYAKRGKLFISADGSIDLKNKLNQLFLDIKSEQSPLDKPKKIAKSKAVSSTKTKGKKAPVPTTEEGVRYKESMLRFNTAKKKAELEIKIKEHDEESKRMKNEKVRKEVVPTVLMRAVLSAYSAATRQAYYDGLDSFLILLTHKINLSSDDESSFRKQLNEVINTSDTKAIDIARKAVEAIVEEYSESRGIGEAK